MDMDTDTERFAAEFRLWGDQAQEPDDAWDRTPSSRARRRKMQNQPPSGAKELSIAKQLT